MPFRPPASIVSLAVAVVTVGSVAAAVGWTASQATIGAGFWWEDAPFALSPDDALKIGGGLTDAEVARMKALSGLEVRRAFEGLRIDVTDDRDAFWRIAVVGTPLTTTRNRVTSPFSAAGESRIFGPLGGAGSVAFMILSHNAIEHAPPGASREQIVDGIGRGIGRAAVHELTHQALGVDNVRLIDNRTDPNSYEYANADRAEQFYGEVHWTTARGVLQKKFGR